jgi:hypothetical protein
MLSRISGEESLSRFSGTEEDEENSNLLETLYHRMLHEQRANNERENQLVNRFREQTHDLFQYFMNNVIATATHSPNIATASNISDATATGNITQLSLDSRYLLN